MPGPEKRDILDSLDLVRQAQSGEKEAISVLFNRYYGRVHRIVRRRLGGGLRDAMESADIVQDAMTDAIRAFEHFEIREDRALIGWFAAIVENRIRAANKRLRAVKRDRRREVALDIGEPDASGVGIELVATELDPHETVAAQEQSGIVEEALQELDEKLQRVIVLRLRHAASWEAIAREMSRPSPDAARMLYARAKIELRKAIRRRVREDESV